MKYKVLLAEAKIVCRLLKIASKKDVDEIFYATDVLTSHAWFYVRWTWKNYLKEFCLEDKDTDSFQMR